jgi:hypothetical protein
VVDKEMSYLGGKEDFPVSIGDIEYADNDLLNRKSSALFRS